MGSFGVAVAILVIAGLFACVHSLWCVSRRRIRRQLRIDSYLEEQSKKRGWS